MTDQLAWGADWLNEISNEHASFEVTVSWRNNDEIVSRTLTANVVDEEGNIIRGTGEIKAQVDHTKFMFNTVEVFEKSIPLGRGLRVEWDGYIYELVLQGRHSYFYNDAYKRKIVVITKHVSN